MGLASIINPRKIRIQIDGDEARDLQERQELQNIIQNHERININCI